MLVDYLLFLSDMRVGWKENDLIAKMHSLIEQIMD